MAEKVEVEWVVVEVVEVEREVKKEHLARRQRVYGGHARRGVHEGHLAEEGVGGGVAVALVVRERVEQRQLHLALEDAQLAVEQDVELVARPPLLEDGHLCGRGGREGGQCATTLACGCAPGRRLGLGWGSGWGLG